MSTATSLADLTCSMASLAQGDDPVGSATDFSSFLLLSDNEPWSREAAADAARRYLSADAAEYCADGATGLRVFAIRSPQRTLLPTGGLPAFVGRVDGELHRLASPPDRLTLDAYTAGRPVDVGAAEPGPLFGVCTNGRRDQCCAVLGRPIATSLAQRFGSRINEISHLGGHRYAGTMIVLPTGYVYGFLDPERAAEVVEQAMAGLVHPENLRGRAGLSPAAQAADAWWRRQLGPAPMTAVRITGTQIDGVEAWVEALVDGVATAVRVHRRIDGRVTETRCGGKPFSIVRWEISAD